MLWVTVDRCGRRGILLLSMTMTGLASLILLGLMECKWASVGTMVFVFWSKSRVRERKLFIVFASSLDPFRLPSNHPLLLKRNYVRLIFGLKIAFSNPKWNEGRN